MSRDELDAALAEGMADAPALLAAFGARLRAVREERGMSRDELAATAETTVSHLQAVEDGLEDPMYFLSLRLADALETTLGAIAEGDGDERA
jgi:transcriptional regulator with XRE-family HTH domain